jgi:hypothetical protein
MTFLRHILAEAEVLTGSSVFNWWFPTEIQKIIEPLLQRKTLTLDVAGILGVIMFAGLDFEDEEFFLTQIIEKAFEERVKHNELFESQQNLSTLLFGITVDNVSKIPMYTHPLSIANIGHFYCSALVS